MNYDNVKDYRLLGHVQKLISECPKHSTRVSLRSMRVCCHKPAKYVAGITLIANSKHSRLVNAHTCNNAWACPVCSAIKMSRYAAKIAAAIDALKKTHAALMFTFTIFHSKNDSCRQAFDVLFETWKLFMSGRGKGNGLVPNFLADMEIKHRVRCGEVTYSENGWHPHFHCLFWVPYSKLNQVLDYENKLRARWRECQAAAMKKIYGYAKYNAFAESEKLHGEIAAGVYISKNDKGQPAIMKSSDYLCGWGADKELTGNYRKEATSKNSRTPFQLLQCSFDGDQMASQLFLELAEYVVLAKRRRVDFSRTGLAAIIQNHMNSEGYKTVMKKKRTQYLEEMGDWHLVCWFSSELWSKICFENLVPDIMELGYQQNAYDLICKLLLKFNIKEMPLRYDPIGDGTNFLKLLQAA